MTAHRLGVDYAFAYGALLPGDVAIENGSITTIGLPPPGTGLIAAPGLVDLQVNGFGGVDFASASREQVAQSIDALIAVGSTSIQATLISSDSTTTRGAIETLSAFDNRRVVGVHLEGPFISHHFRGAHPNGALRAPDVTVFRELTDLGRVTQLTLAPELPAVGEVITAAVGIGCVVSLGHCAPSEAELSDAIAAGARSVTHWGNAMAIGTAREPGIGLVAMARDDLMIQIIGDGRHVNDQVLRLVFALASKRVVLVTDAAAPAGMRPGKYTIGGQPVFSDGKTITNEEGLIAGGAATLADCVAHVANLVGSPETALRCATETPAKLLGRSDIGRLHEGAVADLVVLDAELRLARVYLAGVEVRA